MNRINKIELALQKGYKYDPISGNVYGLRGNPITKKTNGYLTLTIYDGQKYIPLYAHQFAYYCIHGEIVDCIDHINCNKSDNRIENLRKIDPTKNVWNMVKMNKKNIKGWTYRPKRKTNKYESKITVNNKTIILGHFETQTEAEQSYFNAKQIYHII